MPRRLALYAGALLFAVAARADTVQFEQAAYSVGEGVGLIEVNVVRGGNLELPASVFCTTSAGTASDKDFFVIQRTLTFDPGERSRTFNAFVRQDEIDEPDQTFHLTLSDPVGVLLGATSTAAVTIVDDDAQPTLRFEDVGVVVTEGKDAIALIKVVGGSRGDSFYPPDIAASELPVSVEYATYGGTATAGADYTETRGTITGTTGTIAIPIHTDAINEGAEAFGIRLSNPVNAILEEPDGEVAIIDPAGRPAIYAMDTSFYPTHADMWVQMRPASSERVTVKLHTEGGGGYRPLVHTLTFEPGQTLAKLTYIAYDYYPRACSYGSSLFWFDLSEATNADIVRRRGTLTVVYSGSYPWWPMLPWDENSEHSIVEGNSGEPAERYEIRSGCNNDLEVVVEDGTARRGVDYEVEYNINSNITVKILGDTRSEWPETFVIRLLVQQGSSWSDLHTCEFTIVDDDPPAVADLSAKVDFTRPVYAGKVTTFRIAVSNAGPDAATSVVVTDTLPPGSTYVPQQNAASLCSANENVITCPVGTIENGKSASLFITALMPPQPGTWTNFVTVSSDARDPAPAGVSTEIEAALPATTIPTLDEWALLLLGLAIATAALRAIRSS